MIILNLHFFSTVPSHNVVSGGKLMVRYCTMFVSVCTCILITCVQYSVGSVLLAYAGEGGDGGCFFQLSEDSTMTGFTLYYPKQDPKLVPKPYPW